MTRIKTMESFFYTCLHFFLGDIFTVTGNRINHTIITYLVIPLFICLKYF